MLNTHFESKRSFLLPRDDLKKLSWAPFGWGGWPCSADGPRLQSGFGESFATHVSHSGAFALDSTAGNSPRLRVCLFPWTMDVPELVVK